MFDYLSYPFAVRSIFRSLWRYDSRRSEELGRIVITEDDLHRLATTWEQEHPRYDHDKLMKALKTTLHEGREAELCTYMGKGYYEVTLVCRAAYREVCASLHDSILSEARKRGSFFQYEVDLLKHYDRELATLDGVFEPVEVDPEFPVISPAVVVEAEADFPA